MRDMREPMMRRPMMGRPAGMQGRFGMPPPTGMPMRPPMMQRMPQVDPGYAMPTPPEAKVAYTGPLGANQAMASGGPISGPGTGRSDDIPARLSDGEYVIDSETVSMLGDGSAAAGAAKLDQMRRRLRTHKGRALAKGKFSPAAKSPERYLSGRT